MRRGEPAVFEGVADDGEAGWPVGVVGGAPEREEGAEDVLVRVEGACVEQNACVGWLGGRLEMGRGGMCCVCGFGLEWD